ncbi:MAG: nucleoside deaminase [Verrucomicrobiales bacterium]|nr:nucleoside deaminase [Verrucomicrobiales bacterium]
MNPEFMRAAIRVAREHLLAGEGGPFGAIVVRKDDVVGEGWNRVTSALDPTAHAEVEAIRAACRRLGDFRLAGCDIYATCEPCPMCLAACYWARLDRIYFAGTREDAAAAGFDDAAIYHEITLAPWVRRLPAERLLAEEGLELFRLWREKADRVPY